MSDSRPIFPYYPAQIVPLGLTLRTHDASAPVIQYVHQDGDQVKVACLWRGHIVEKKYRFNEVVYIDVAAGRKDS
jgi:hypothetical protein